MTKKYAVVVGKEVGIYQSWQECRQQTEGVKGNKFMSFSTQGEAEEYLKRELGEEKYRRYKQGQKEKEDRKKNNCVEERSENQNRYGEEETEKSTTNEQDKDRDVEEQWFDAELMQLERGIGEDQEEEELLSQPVVTLRRREHAEEDEDTANEEEEKEEGEKKEEEEGGNNDCPTCERKITKSTIKAILCDKCSRWYHANRQCGKELEAVFTQISKLKDPQKFKWFCNSCEAYISSVEERLEQSNRQLEREGKRAEERENTIAKLKAEVKRLKENLKEEEQQRTKMMEETNGNKRWISDVARIIGAQVKKKDEDKELDEKEIIQSLKRRLDENKKNERSLKDEIKQYKKNLEENIVEKRELQKALQDTIDAATTEPEGLIEKKKDEAQVEREKEIKSNEKKAQEIPLTNTNQENKETTMRGNIEERTQKQENQQKPKKEQTQPRRANNNEKICIWFNKGVCRFNDHCRFKHEKICASVKNKVPCRRGDQCSYSHDDSIICRYEECRKEDCKFIHRDRAKQQQLPRQQQDEAKMETKPNKGNKIEELMETFFNKKIKGQLTRMITEIIEKTQESINQADQATETPTFLEEGGIPPQ